MKIGLLGVGHQGKRYIETFKRLTMELDWTSNVPRFDADAIIIATPAETHYELAKEAINSGKHVLIEKPMVMDRAEAEELYALAVKQNITGFVNHVHLYSPAWREMKSKVDEIVSIVSVSGGPCKTDPRWDWGSHDVAMRLDLTDKYCKHERYISEIICDRMFKVICKDKVLIYDDPVTDPLPMDVLVKEFVEACHGTPDPSGIKMGLEVTKILCSK